jgi:hypothetical protein
VRRGRADNPRRERPRARRVAPGPPFIWAARQIAEHGWRGRDVALLLGASGGPKWLILGHLDRLLFGDFLLEHSAMRPCKRSVPPWAPGATPAWPRTIPSRLPSSASRTSTSTGPTAKNRTPTRSVAPAPPCSNTSSGKRARRAARGASVAAQLHRHGPRPRPEFRGPHAPALLVAGLGAAALANAIDGACCRVSSSSACCSAVAPRPPAPVRLRGAPGHARAPTR